MSDIINFNLIICKHFYCSFGLLIIGISDPCSSNPCQNSGTCISYGTGYICLCGQGYSGINCQNSKIILFQSLKMTWDESVFFKLFLF